ncbi:hypothetical protein NS283_17460, partial [Microbacterium testaceum]
MPKTRRTGLIVTLVVGGVLAVLAVWPQIVGAQRLQVVAQLIPFRGILAIGLAALAVVAGVIAVLRRRWGVAAGLAMVLAAASLGNAGVLV